MKLEVLLIVNDTELYHRSVSTLNDGVNPYTGAINAMVNELTALQSGRIQSKLPNFSNVPKEDKFTQAVPSYNANTQQDASFHPDLVKQGVVGNMPPVLPPNPIPTIKLDMKSILKGK